MRIILIIIFQFGATILSYGQQENEIKSVIDQMFKGMVIGDSALVHKVIDKGCSLKSIIRKKDGTTVVVDEPFQEFLKSVGEPPKNRIEERLLSYDIKLDGEMAMAWTPYEFYVDEKLSHCGVNVFMLAKRNNTWLIISITDTRRRDCK
jgi:hypothetical protein